MSWTTLYLIVGILAGALGIWTLARGGNSYLSIAGILWFLIVLFRFYVGDIWGAVLISGVPSIGQLLLYLALPVFVLLAFFNVGRR